MIGELHELMDRQRYRQRAFLLAAIAVFITLIASSIPAFAQGADPARRSSFSLSPLLLALDGMPGRPVDFDIFLANDTSHRAASFEISVVPVKTKADGQFELLFDRDDPYSAADWIELDTTQITVPPSAGVQVTGRVNIPRNVRGGRYAAVVFTLIDDEARDPEARASSVVRYRVATIIELSIGTRFVKRGYLSDLFITPGSEISSLTPLPPNSILIRGRFVNEGDIHVFVNGSLVIRNEQGRVVDRIPLGAGRGAVYPDTTLEMGSILSRGLPPGEYDIQAVVHYGGLRPAIARTTVTVEDRGVQNVHVSGGPSLRFDVHPTDISFEVPAGALRNAVVTVHNVHEDPIRVTASLQPLIHDQDGLIDVSRMEEGAGSVEWIAISPDAFVLHPNQRRNVRVTVREPGLGVRAHYYYLLFEAEEFDRHAQETIADGLDGEAGVAVSILPRATLEPEAELASLTLHREDGGLGGDNGEPSIGQLEIAIINTGPIDFDGTGTISLWHKIIPEAIDGIEYEGDGMYVEVLSDVLPSEWMETVLPGETRSLSVGLPPFLEPGEYRIGVDIRYGGAVPLAPFADFILESIHSGEVEGQ